MRIVKAASAIFTDVWLKKRKEKWKAFYASDWTVVIMVLITVLIIKKLSFLIIPFLLESTLTSSQVHSSISYFRCLGWRTCHVVLALRRGNVHQSAVTRVLIISWFCPLGSDHVMVNHTTTLFSLIISLFLQIIASWSAKQKERERGLKSSK